MRQRLPLQGPRRIAEAHMDMLHDAWKMVVDKPDHVYEGAFNERADAKLDIDVIRTSATQYVLLGCYFLLMKKLHDVATKDPSTTSTAHRKPTQIVTAAVTVLRFV